MKRIRYFILSAGGILLAAALARFLVAAGSAQALALPEPMLGIPLRYAVLLVGGLELAVALICLFGKQARLQIAWLTWLASNFFIYRIGLFWMHCHPQATCIGSLTDPLHLSRGITGFLIGLLPVYLVLGSYAALIWLWLIEPALARRRKERMEAIKMACPSCGVHIRFSSQNLGQKIPCPQCQKSMTLRRPENLKISCYFCKEHIEFPAHAIGHKMPCPHCNRDITLQLTGVTT